MMRLKNKETGKVHVVEAVDAREYLKTGAYVNADNEDRINNTAVVAATKEVARIEKEMIIISERLVSAGNGSNDQKDAKAAFEAAKKARIEALKHLEKLRSNV